MGMFWVQLRQLMWKNLLIRKRSKIRVATELVWPVILFVILALVRTKGLKEYKNECFLEERALPSAGPLIFLQSLICTFDNNCHSSPASANRLIDEFEFDNVRGLIRDLTNISKRRITDEEVAKGSGVAIDVTAGVAFAFKTISSGSSPKTSFPFKNVISRDAFQRLVSSKNASQTSALFESIVHIPPPELSKDVLRYHIENPRQVFCNTSLLKSWVTAPDESTLQTLSQVFCQSTAAEIISVLNGTLLVNQAQRIVEENIEQPLHLEDWANLGRLLNTILSDISDLDSLSMIVKKFSSTTLGKLTEQLWRSRNNEPGNATSTMSFLNSTANILCGKNTLIRERKPSDFPDGPESFQIGRLSKSQSATVTRSNLTKPCLQLFIGLQQNPLTRMILELFYPFIRGKLIYAPKNTAFDRVISHVNETFQDLRIVQRFAGRWLEEISPALRRFLNQLDPTTIANVTEIIKDRVPGLNNVTSFPTNMSNQIISIKESLVKLDLVANLVNTYVECYEFDKFEGYATEEEAVERGKSLIDIGGLWAVIVFKAQNNNLTSQDLPHNITYKLRMDSSKIDSTKRLRDFFETPLPRTNPTKYMKYFTSGYIFLQDKIEQAIIKLQSNRSQLPGMYMQQFPSPCYTFDTFFLAIAGLFPLFMVLSFVYTCAMIVKSIVREKERRLKETMKTMGLGNAVHWVAWFIDSMSFMLISCVLLSMILVFGGILENSNFLIVLIFVLSFSIATICFSFLVSTFFSRANLAAACGGFFFFACFLPYNFFNLNGQDYSLGILILASLMSDVSFGIGCFYFASHEQSGEGAQWSNIATSPKDGDAYSLLGCILMMLFDAVLYLILTWYVETVFPGQYGIPKPWYFMFQPSYWFSSKRRNSIAGGLPSSHDAGLFFVCPSVRTKACSNFSVSTLVADLIEEESRDLMIGVSIRDLGKIYSNGKVALRNLHIDFYEDQITSFLGHNGAGKTTTISILTGLFPPSSGTATINGLDIRYQMDDIRRQLGVCPQHNVLFDQLTVEEHLRFYANLKTGEQIESRKEIDKMIEDLGLSHKKHDISEHLSGGMKRKLSIGSAFIGNSKTVILDEPTAGVDPYSRRSIWDILLKYKTGRTIILTTHFMDEADLLGDRIAIISQGQLKCCGSSLFLKQKLGSGYYLTVVRKDESERNVLVNGDGQGNADPVSRRANETDKIVNVVKQHIPNVNIVENVGSDIVFCLPEVDEAGVHQRDKFPLLFDELDLKMEELRVDSYGINDTTLEEIFLKVANDPSEESFEPKVEPEQDEEVPQTEENVTSDTFSLLSSEKLTGAVLICQQFFALYVKRFCNSKRNLKGFFCEIVLPALLIIINQLTTMQLSAISPEPSIELSPWLYGSSNVAFYANANPNEIWNNRYIKNMLNETGMGTRCQNNVTSFQCNSNTTGLLNPFVNPDDYVDFQCPCNMGVAFCPANLTAATLLHRYKSVSTDDFYDVTGKDIAMWIVRTYKTYKKFRSGGFEFGLQNPFEGLNLTLFSKDVQDLMESMRFPLPLQLNASGEILNFENITRLSGTFDKVKVWYDHKAWASSVSYLNAINNVILRSSMPTSKTFYSITAVNHPMNYSTKQLEDRFMKQVGISVLHAISVIFSMSFVPASFVIFLVEERKSKTKHLQFISGVKPITFWVASYTWDMMNYLIPSALVIFIFIGFDQQAYIGPKNIAGMILLLILYGLSAIALMYPASLVFSVPSSAFVGLACGNLFIGVITTISSFVLQLFDDAQLKLIGSILNEVYLIFPHYCLGRGMIDMAQVHYTTQRLELLGLDYPRNIFEWDYLGRYFLSMVLQAVVFFSFTVLLHYQVLPESVVRYFQRTQLQPLPLEDEDVARERERVEQIDDESTDELRLLRLTKVYGRGTEPATNRLSFGLKKGECFGLLGVNGAGKSTTFKMLTGDETVTSGNAFVGGYSILSNLTEAQQNLGYCPQEDALLSLLTGAEHLRLFARLRGVPQKHMDKVVNESLKKLGLLPYKNRCAGTYSGGNKRKLSTAIAFIGNPAVVFLDEPSSGMDPKARRSLWSAIIDALKGSRSILLTSHSMEECQVLCTRLAIMVNGTLRCLGSAQHLKNRFGNGYMISARCEMEYVSDVLQSVQSVIPEARLRERRSRQLIWHIQPNVLSIASLFNRMEAARAATQMVDYSITQTTLDDVFLRFARLQRETNEESDDNNEQGLEDVPLHSRTSHGLTNQDQFAVSINTAF
ncbi:ATP-binding cassette sub-family A member 7-like isoform X2 [Daphnia pulex]|uniref:ATP-binding cassette sub-family A member 7-like isoform X2 n=1 Tax=Daphnia pulex TaxID=6669 RepID=UPI001EDEE698|nr:ATP-binding cassette sub-family A member 7-like isoform X2 [Daphnia pulex]